MMRDDDNPPDTASIPRAPMTLPPEDRIKREALHMALYFTIFVGSLLANKWEVPHAPDMSTVVFTILGINAALRKGEHRDR